ncbi:SHOCT-like domain-containing protein [Virgibacillus kimchii]
MSEEIKRVLKMVEDGKMQSGEAAELIEALREVPDAERKTSTKSYLDKMLKIRVYSDEKDQVNVNVPVRFVRTMLKLGQGIAGNIPAAKEYASDIDMDVIIEAIDNEMEGKIVDIQSSSGEIVAVYIE